MHPIVAADLAKIVQSPLPFDQFDGATVLVTGANGFLPAYIVETLLRATASAAAGPRPSWGWCAARARLKPDLPSISVARTFGF